MNLIDLDLLAPKHSVSNNKLSGNFGAHTCDNCLEDFLQTAFPICSGGEEIGKYSNKPGTSDENNYQNQFSIVDLATNAVHWIGRDKAEASPCRLYYHVTNDWVGDEETVDGYGKKWQSSGHVYFIGRSKMAQIAAASAPSATLTSYVLDVVSSRVPVVVFAKSKSASGISVQTRSGTNSPPCVASVEIENNGVCDLTQCGAGFYASSFANCVQMTTFTCGAGLAFTSSSSKNLLGSTLNDGVCSPCPIGTFKSLVAASVRFTLSSVFNLPYCTCILRINL